MHLTSNPVDWYAARAAGIVAYVLLTVVVSIGISLAGRAPGRGRRRRWPMCAVEDVHRAGGLLVGVFIAIHVLTIAIDSFLPFSVGQLVVPLASAYRPLSGWPWASSLPSCSSRSPSPITTAIGCRDAGGEPPTTPISQCGLPRPSTGWAAALIEAPRG